MRKNWYMSEPYAIDNLKTFITCLGLLIKWIGGIEIVHCLSLIVILENKSYNCLGKDRSERN